MDIFGTGGGSSSHGGSNSGSSGKMSDEQANWLLGCGILFAIFVVTAKYLPMMIVGSVLGGILYFSRFHLRSSERARAFLGTFVLLALTWFALVGAPLAQWRGEPKYYPGLLFGFESFWGPKGFVVQAMNEWNQFWPQFLLKHLAIRHVTQLQVAQYFWGMIGSAIGFMALYFIIAYFKKREATSDSLKRAVTEIPVRIFGALSYPFCKFWVKSGYWKAPPTFSWKSYLLEAGVLLVVGLGVRYWLVPQIPWWNLQVGATGLAMLPLISFSVGFAIRNGWEEGGPYRILFGELPPVIELGTSGDPKLPKPHPRSGFLLGHTFQGYPFELSEKNLAYHVEMVAPTGSGKTNTLKNLIADRILRGHGLIFLDLKAEFNVVDWVYRVARSVGREKDFRLLSLADRTLSVPYNPIKYGTAPEIHSQLMGVMKWSEEYYRSISSVALMTVLRGLCEYRDKTGERFHLRHLYSLFESPGLMRVLAEKLGAHDCQAAKDVAVLAEKLDKNVERDKLSGLVANFSDLIHSAAGELLSTDVAQGSFDFREALDQGKITYLLVNNMKLKEAAGTFGKIILQDLMSQIGDRYSQIEGQGKHRPTTLIIDEFAQFAQPSFIDFMDRARGAGVSIVLAHQSRADLKQVSPEFQERIEANANTTFVSGVKSSVDAEHYAGMLGTRKARKETVQVKRGLIFEERTGMESTREVEEYVVHPNEVKALKQGEVFAVSRTVDPKWALVKVPTAHEFDSEDLSRDELVSALKEIRSSYQEKGIDRYIELTKEPSSPGAPIPGLKSDPVRGDAEISMEKASWE